MESATVEKITTDLTCWKCGEEMLQPASAHTKSIVANDGRTSVIGNEHSVCGKCGTLSVNAAQARHNKVVNRKSRRASIREANRRAS